MAEPKRKGKHAHKKQENGQVNEADSHVTREEVNFPRGGGSSLTPLEYRDTVKEAERELFSTQGAGTEPAKKKRKKDKQDKGEKKHKKSKVEEDDSGDPKHKSVKVEPLSFKRLTVGTTILGCISSIHDLDMAVSLPNHLTGYVAITEISDKISKLVEKAAAADEDEDMEDEDQDMDSETALPDLKALFHVGQWVRCIILELDDGKKGGGAMDKEQKSKKRIELSLKPNLVNNGVAAKDLIPGMTLSATVVSVEDHGYLLSTGIDKLSGFLNHKDAKSYIDEFNHGKPLMEGALLDISIKSVAENERTFSCVANPQLVRKAMTETPVSNINSLIPGNLVQGIVTATSAKGLSVQFMGFFDAVIDRDHCGLDVMLGIQSPEDAYAIGSKVKARIIYCALNTSPKRIGLALSSHIVDMIAPGGKKWQKKNITAAFPIGTILDSCVIKRVDPNLGLVCQVEGLDEIAAFVHISRVSDEHLNALDESKGAFRFDTKHKGRVLGFDHFDGVLQLSFQESILQQKYLRIDDIKVGEIVKAPVEKVTTHGVIISLTDTIHALIPNLHLSDVKLSNPEKKFNVGSKVSTRVLAADASNKRVILTAKRSIVNSDLPIISSYEEATPGKSTHGVITSVRDNGCLVTFYSDVHGFVPLAELSETYIKNPHEHFKVGQVVKCTVLTVQPAEGRLRLSFKGAASIKASDAATKADLSAVEIGSQVSGRIVALSQTIVTLSLVPSQIRAILPTSHISDHVGVHVQHLFDSLKEGQELENLVVLDKNQEKSNVLVSHKSALQKGVEAKVMPKSLDDVKVGAIIPGFVRSVTENGVFVGFLGGLTGLAMKRALSDKFVASPTDLFVNGQTVLARVTDIDEATGHFHVSLKTSDVPLSDVSFLQPGEFVQSYFSEVQRTLGGKDTSLHIGQAVEAVIKQALSYGSIVDLPGGMSGFITLEQAKGQDIKEVGSKVLSRVLDVDSKKQIADLSVRADLIADDGSKAKTAGVSSKQIKKLQTLQQNATEVDAQIELIKEDYLVLTLPQYNNVIAFAATKILNDRTKPFMRFKLGERTRVVITHVPTKTMTAERVLVTLQPRRLDDNKTIREPVDPTITSFEDYVPGRIVKALVKSVKATQLNVNLAANVKGRVHVTQAFDSYDDIEDTARPLHHWKPNQIIDAKVIGYHDAKSNKFLPISHRVTSPNTVIDLTIKPTQLETPDKLTGVNVSVEDLDEAKPVLVFISSVSDDGILVNVSQTIKGKIVKNRLPIGANLDDYKQGMAVQCQIVSKVAKSEFLVLSLRDTEEVQGSQLTYDTLTKGMQIPGTIAKITPTAGLIVRLAKDVFGRVHLTDIGDTLKDDPTNGFKVGQSVNVVVLDVDRPNERVALSLRKSAFDPSSKPKDQDIQTINDVVVDSLVKGYVHNVANHGLFIALSHSINGRVKISEISDLFVKDWQSMFKKGQLVTARVLSVNAKSNQVELSLKASVLDPSKKPTLILSDFKVGQKVNGTIKGIEKFGVFIKIDQTDISGLCHISEISDTRVSDLSKIYEVGDPVKAIILDIVPESRKISFGLKSSYFDAEDLEESEDEGEEDDGEDVEYIMDQVDGNDVDAIVNGLLQKNDDDSEDEIDEDEEEEGSDGASADEDDVVDQDMQEDDDDDDVMDEDLDAIPTGGFKWDGTAPEVPNEVAESASESESDGGDQPTKKSKRHKKNDGIVDRTADLNSEAPQVASDYERLLLGSPNSSFLWINYMAFQLQLAEIDKAREIGERALKTINFREEQEKMNVWVAMMNLENTYGTEESLQAVFQRALQVCEPKKVYLQLANIYERAEKVDVSVHAAKGGEDTYLTEETQRADEMYQTIVKKFSQSSKVWTIYGQFCMQQQNVERARELLQQSLKSLPKRKYIKTIIKFAQMEFKQGEPERGRTLFEKILSEYPKRVDLWSVYLDMEIKVGDPDLIRRLFARVTTLKLSSKKMKFFFKKWLGYEKEHGAPQHIEEVKRRAMAYVASSQ